MVNLSKVLLKLSDKLKPFLIRILPIAFLRKVKQLIIDSSYKRIDRLQIEPFDKDKYVEGINLIGNIRAEIGLGQSCRLLANELEASNIDFIVLNYVQVSALHMNDHTWDYKLAAEAKYNINIIHINPYELGLAYLQLDKCTWDFRYNIAFWLWELEEFPDEWTSCLPYLDEIWTPSEFASNSIRKKTDKPVITIPYYITVPTEEKYNREYFRLPEEKFLYLIMYDCGSTIERKNPLGAIEAYKIAYPVENENVGLIIKINNMQKMDLDIIKDKTKEYKNVYFITDIMQKIQVNSLIKCADVLISLHRAEGFGLVLAEAMLLGTPTIATNWSSNTEFMTEKDSCLVDYRLIRIEKDCGIYKAGYRWADPDLNDASKFILKLYEQEEYYYTIKQAAQDHIEIILGAKQASANINERIRTILLQ